MPRRQLIVFLCAGALASAGCASQHIVRASPAPSVSAPTVEENPAPPEAAPPPATATVTEPAPEPEPPAPAPAPAAPAKRPATRPHPAQQPETSEAAAAPAAPKAEAPVISPELSANDLAAAKRNTASNINEAQKNLQATNGKNLNAAQNDLVAKVQGFLAQAQEAIHAEDWVRAANLADKARVLSVELVKGL